MTETGAYSIVERRELERKSVDEEMYKQIEELSVNERTRKVVKCESCIRKECMGQWYERVSVFLCFLCKMYVCAKCWPKHDWHEGIKKERKESGEMGELKERERNKGRRLWKKIKGIRMEAESKRKREREENESDKMGEQSERERMRRKFVFKLVNESKITRTERFFNSHPVVCDRIELNHELDQGKECWITGLCGLENKRLVVIDSFNLCIKIFKLGSHVLQRYIRFDSKPQDVTEMHLKQNFTKPNLESGSSAGISGTADQDKQCLIGVTLPWKQQIIFVDLSKKATIQKVIKTEGQCHCLQFYDDKIFTICKEDMSDPYSSVYIKSTDGGTLFKFNAGIYGYPYLAINSGRVYLTDWYGHKVQCRNDKHKVVSEISIKGSEPDGITIDSDNNVYVCAYQHNKVYKLNSDLTRYKSLLDQTSDYIKEPRFLCYYRDKLYISHHRSSPSQNIITVVRLL